MKGVTVVKVDKPESERCDNKIRAGRGLFLSYVGARDHYVLPGRHRSLRRPPCLCLLSDYHSFASSIPGFPAREREYTGHSSLHDVSRPAENFFVLIWILYGSLLIVVGLREPIGDQTYILPPSRYSMIKRIIFHSLTSSSTCKKNVCLPIPLRNLLLPNLPRFTSMRTISIASCSYFYSRLGFLGSY